MPFPQALRPALLLLLLSLNACFGPSYPKQRLEASVQEICRKEYGLAVRARLVGRTLYCRNVVDGLVGADLDMEPKKFESLDKMLRVMNRVALSTDADVEFLVIQLQDGRLSSQLDLLQRVEDYRSLRNMRISHDGFQDGLVLEWFSDAPSRPERDIPYSEFIARLAASRLQRKITGNPLVSVFLQVQAVQGRVEEGALILTLERGRKSDLDFGSNDVLESAVADVCTDVFKKYDAKAEHVRLVRLEDEDGKVFWESGRDELARRVSSPAKQTPA